MAMNFQEAALLQRARRGDGNAALRLFERYGGALYGLGLGVLGVPHDAENLVATVAEELFHGQTKYSLTMPVLPQLVRRMMAHLRIRTAGQEKESGPVPPADEPNADAWRALGTVLSARPVKDRLRFYSWAATGLTVSAAARIAESPRDEFQAELAAVLKVAGLNWEVAGRGPLAQTEATSRLLDLVEEVLFDESAEGARLASARRHQYVRRRTSAARSKGLGTGWLSLLVAFGVILIAAWALDRRAREKRAASRPTPTASATSSPPRTFEVHMEKRDDPAPNLPDD